MKNKSDRVLKIVQKYHPQVTKVRDAKHGITIEVTSEDCSKSTQKAPNNCAMANAFKRSFDGAIISTGRAYLVRGDTAWRYEVPEGVSREIVSFDRHADFRPGHYSLRAPCAANQLGKKCPPGVTKPEYQTHRQRAVRTQGIRAL